MERYFLAKDGRPEVAIVVDHNAGAFYRWVAGEIQRYLKQLSGAELPIVTNDQVPAQTPPVIVGGPTSKSPFCSGSREATDQLRWPQAREFCDTTDRVGWHAGRAYRWQ